MKNLSDILASCLEDIKSGRAVPEECLARHEDVRAELEPLLRLALDVETLPHVTPSAAFKARTRAALLETIHNEQVAGKGGWSLGGLFARSAWVRVTAVALAMALVISGAGAGTVFASGDSLPGETLYSVKTGWEDVRDWLEADASASSELRLEFAETRLDEMLLLLQRDPGRLELAASRYEHDLELALQNAESAGNETPVEQFSLEIMAQLETLFNLQYQAGEAPGAGLEHARNAAANRHMSALRTLAGFDAASSGNLTIQAMEQAMGQAAEASGRGRIEHAEKALGSFVEYSALCEEIRFAAGDDTAEIDALYDSTCSAMQQHFAGISDKVPAGVAEKVRSALEQMQQHRHGQDGPGNNDAGNHMGPGSSQSGHTDISGTGQDEETVPGTDSPTPGGAGESHSDNGTVSPGEASGTHPGQQAPGQGQEGAGQNENPGPGGNGKGKN